VTIETPSCTCGYGTEGTAFTRFPDPDCPLHAPQSTATPLAPKRHTEKPRTTTPLSVVDQLADIFDGTPPPGADVLIPQLAKQLLADHRFTLVELAAATARLEAAEACQLQAEEYAETYIEAFERLSMRVHRDFNFDAGESAAPADERWARVMDDLVTFTEELADRLDPMGGVGEPTPHLVDVTRLPKGFDSNDTRPHEYVIGNDVFGRFSHQVTHSAACHLLPYGKLCWFDDEWHNGQFAYDNIEPGRYAVTRGRQDVGDHHGEYSHTDEFLHYERIGDAPERPAAAPSGPLGAGNSQEPPF